MRPARHQVTLVGLVLISLALAACSSAPFRHEAYEHAVLEQRAETQHGATFTVSATVPGEQEAKRWFGVPLYDRDIQPVWLEVHNPGPHRARLTFSSIDPKYFSPHEVAYMHRKRFTKDGWKAMEAYLHDSALPRQIAPGATASGFVFTHRVPGTKA
jgi:hypothetical protein